MRNGIGPGIELGGVFRYLNLTGLAQQSLDLLRFLDLSDLCLANYNYLLLADRW